jgi:hypothetical protein
MVKVSRGLFIVNINVVKVSSRTLLAQGLKLFEGTERDPTDNRIL